MFKLIFWNTVWSIVLFVTLIFALHYFFVRNHLVSVANKSFLQQMKNPYFNNYTFAIGQLPNKNNPTSYLKITPDKNKIKVGCFGDSHTMGSEVLTGHDFPTVLQKILGPEYQVINFGQGGYNSNQIYLMVKTFSRLFDLDIVVLGPRGFYKNRATSFNNYWNQGSVPYARFILENNKLKMVQVPGKTIQDKINNYFSFLPSLTLLKYDHVPPSFLKLTDIVFKKEILNPFNSDNRKSSVRRVQVEQLKNLASSLNKKIIHYTDFQDDCTAFSSIKTNNYSLFCVEPIINKFPYMAEISHPSSFGHFHHAQNLKSIIMHNTEFKNEFKFIDNVENFYTTKVSGLTGEKIDFRRLIVVAGNEVIASLSDNRGYANRTGLLVNFSVSEPFTENNSLIVGIYIEGQSRANSLFLEVPMELIMSKFNNIQFEALNGIKNILFHKVKAKYINYSKNKIVSSEKWISTDPIYSLFSEVEELDYSYASKYPSHKFIVKKEIYAYDFLKKFESKNIILNFKKKAH